MNLSHTLTGPRTKRSQSVLERIHAPGLQAKWREHFEKSRFGPRRSFQVMEDAYRFGAEKADSVFFQGRDWARVAERIRSLWVAEHGALSWALAEEAVRWGFLSYQEAESFRRPIG